MADKREGEGDGKSKSLSQRLVDSHDQFLEALKETYPLGVLSSLSMTIAAFTRDTLPQAQTYAIAASLAFLLAFTFSLILKVMRTVLLMEGTPLVYYISFSHIFTIAGIALLFGVITQFMTIPAVATALLPPSLAISIVFFAFLIPILRNLTKATQPKSVRILSYLFMISFAVSVYDFCLNIYVVFAGRRLPEWWGLLLQVSLLACTVFFALAVMLMIIKKERVRLRKTEPKSVT